MQYLQYDVLWGSTKMNKINIYILLLLLLVGGVFAIPAVDNFAGGLTLELNDYPFHPINEDYFLHTHLYVTDTGVVTNSTESECFYHLYSENVNWEHLIFNGSMGVYGIGFSDTINGSYFNETGDYSFLIWCDEPVEPQAKQGGYEKFYFTVYEDEKSPTNYFEIIGLLAIVLLLVVAFVTGINIMGVITSIGIIIYGLTFMLSSILIGTLVLAGGLLLALYFATRQSE